MSNELTATERTAIGHLTGQSREQRVAEILEMKRRGYSVKHVGKVRTIYDPPPVGDRFTEPRPA